MTHQDDRRGDEGAHTGASTGHWDPLIWNVQEHRRRVGNPSYAVIADRVAAARCLAGLDPYAARVARSTVYDALRPGRQRLNLDLVREVCQALGVTPEVVEQWIESCHRPPHLSRLTAQEPITQPTGGPASAPDNVSPGPAVSCRGDAVTTPTRRHVLWMVVGCVVANLACRQFVDTFGVPLHLDMGGTAVAAIALGPWHGVAVGVSTNVLGIGLSGMISLPFAIVNAAGGLVWGYGVRRWGMGRTLGRFFSLNLVVAALCSVLAIPIAIAAASGGVEDGHGLVVSAVSQVIGNLWLATSLANVMVSVWDKLLCGFIALVVLTVLPAVYRQRFPLAVVLHDMAESERRAGEALADPDAVSA